MTPTTSKLIDALGGPTAVGRIIGRTRQAVANWRLRGFPRDIDTLLLIEAELLKRGIEVKAHLAPPETTKIDRRRKAARPGPAEGAAA